MTNFEVGETVKIIHDNKIRTGVIRDIRILQYEDKYRVSDSEDIYKCSFSAWVTFEDMAKMDENESVQE